jgi:tetratricopeptide (TPR) repeat protein
VLWGERPPKSCLRLVHVYVGRLRALVEPGRRKGSPAGVIASARGGYRLEADACKLDLSRFDGLAARAEQRQAAGEPAAARELLGQALACWRGPLLDGAGARLRRHPAAVAVSRRRMAVALRYADLALDRGDYAGVADRLRDLVEAEPLHEGLAARLMLALAGRGEQAAALDLFADLRNRLDAQLGVTPGAELADAHLRVLRRQLPAPAGRAGRRVPAQLPADIAAFTGRSPHLERLDTLLPDGSGAVVITAIAGTAGIGKTALAVHWAHRVRDRFPDGQLHLDLRGYARTPPLRPAEALARFLHDLGVPAEQVPHDVDEAAALYRSLLAGKRLLVVLDNARDPDQVRPLLPGAPGCLVLITSRNQLTGLVAREGAHRLTLDVLSPDEARTLLARVLGADRVRAEPEAADELARLCGHLPLALRIAAADLLSRPHDTVDGYAARLRRGNRLAALQIDGDEQAAVRAAFDLSYAALPPDARRLFRLLGQLPGPDATVDAAAALAGATPQATARLLDQLTAAHLVDQRTPGRFTMHDLLRIYAAEHGDAGEAERRGAISRLFDHYVDTANVAATMLYPRTLPLPAELAPRPATTEPFDDPRDASAWLDAERHNLVAAVRHAAEHGPRPVAWQLAAALHGYFTLRGPTEDWLTTASAALAAAEAERQPAAQAAVHLNLTTFHANQDRYRPAIEHAVRGLDLARRAGWPHGQTVALGNLGNLYGELGRLDLSIEHYGRALALAREIGSRGSEAVALHNLAFVHGKAGRLWQSVAYQTEALPVLRELGAPVGEAMALANLGEAYHRLGRFDEALDHLAQALDIQRGIGDKGGECYTARIMAAVHNDAGRHAQALDHARSALALTGEARKRRHEADVLNVLAAIQNSTGDARQAGSTFRAAAELAQANGDRYAHAQALIGLADAYATLGDNHQALLTAHQALGISREAGYRLLEGQALTAVAAAHLREGSLDQAARHGRAAHDVHSETGHRLGLARTLAILGRALHDTDRASAIAHLQRAHLLFADLGVPAELDVRPAAVDVANGHHPTRR